MVKPDQLIKRRGKLGLVGIDLDLPAVRDWLRNHLMKETTVSPGFTRSSIPGNVSVSFSVFALYLKLLPLPVRFPLCILAHSHTLAASAAFADISNVHTMLKG